MRRVAIVMGGRSGEHEISLLSGMQVLRHLDTSKNVPVPVVLTPENRWKVWSEFAAPPDSFEPDGPGAVELSPGHALSELVRLRVDAAFLALHGPYGEDGRIQGFFEMADIPYTGSDHTASALCMDKIQAKRIFEWAGIKTPEWRLSTGSRLERPGEIEELEETFGYPVVVKTPCLGSSVGLAILRERGEFQAFLMDLPVEDDRVLVERYMKGRELTCAILDGPEGPEALPPTEIIPKTAFFFDYEAKYTPGATDEVTPARITPEETRAVQSLSLEIHELMGCRGMSRSDFIYTGSDYHALEINTIPGLTRMSLIPQAAECAGISFTEMIERLIESALRHPRFAGKEICRR